MCLAINIPKGTELKWDLLKNAYEQNSDGFGLMYFSKGNGIHVHKIVPKTWEDVEALLKQYENVLEVTNLALHFRWKTHGDINEANAHPYVVLSKAEHGRDVMLVHNGTITNSPTFDKSMSDTWHFIEYLLRPIVQAKPEMLDTAEGRKALAALMDKFSAGDRFILMDGKTHETILVNGLNKNAAWPEVWLSNTYSLNRSTTTYYSGGGSYNSDWYKSSGASTTKADEGGKGRPLAGKEVVSVVNGNRVTNAGENAAALSVNVVQHMTASQIFLAMLADPDKWLEFCLKLVEEHYTDDVLGDASVAASQKEESA